jgi:hypothetical protein
MGALQGIGTPTPYAASPMPWGNPWVGFTQMGYPLAQPFAQTLPATTASAGYSPYGQSLHGAAQQALQFVPQQLQQIQQLVLPLPQQLQQIQQLVQLVPYQLQQIQQLIHVLAQQPYQLPHSHLLQPFQPPIGISGWQTGQTQLFGGQPGYVM